MVRAVLANGTLEVDEQVRGAANEVLEKLHDRRMGGVVVTLDDGQQVDLPPRLARFVADIVQSIAADGSLATMSLPDELTTTTAAELLGVSRPTLMKMVAHHEVPAKKVGSHTRLRRDDVIALRVRRQEARSAAVQAVRDAGEAFV